MNTITGIRDEEGLTIALDGRNLSFGPSLKVINHSPTGFEIGYGGSGPAQLALAILLKFTNRDTAVRLHQDFKWQVLAKPEYRETEWIKIDIDIPAWINENIKQNA